MPSERGDARGSRAAARGVTHQPGSVPFSLSLHLRRYGTLRAETAAEMGEAAILPGVRRVDNTGLVDDAGGRQHSRDLRCSLRPSWTARPDGRLTDGRRRCPCAVESRKLKVASCSFESEAKRRVANRQCFMGTPGLQAGLIPASPPALSRPTYIYAAPGTLLKRVQNHQRAALISRCAPAIPDAILLTSPGGLRAR